MPLASADGARGSLGEQGLETVQVSGEPEPEHLSQNRMVPPERVPEPASEQEQAAVPERAPAEVPERALAEPELEPVEARALVAAHSPVRAEPVVAVPELALAEALAVPEEYCASAAPVHLR